MAVLKDLIVHGRSRFVNGIDADSIHANLIDANDGIFKTITTTTLDAETITTDMLTAQNARVAQTLTVDGTISTNKWEAANIANIGGNFYISPTGKADSGNITVTKTGSTTINGVSVGVYTLVVGGTSFGVASTSSTIWGTQSKVIFTGSIAYNSSKKYPLGTCNGTMTSVSTGSGTLTGFTITGVNSPALDVFFKEQGVTSVSSTACTGYEMQISVYQSYYSSALHPIGILLTSYGKEQKQYIDIYGGANTLGDSASGFANPSVRIGQLDGLPNIVDNSTDSATAPSGWGIYTTNGFFKGKIVSNAGRIAGWTIGTSAIYNNTSSKTSTTAGTYLGTDAIRNYNSSTQYVHIENGKITAYGADIRGALTATSLSTGTKTSSTSGTGTYIDSSGNIYSGSGSTNNFQVTSAGALTANSGTIGGWSFNSSYGLYTNSKTSTTSTNSGILIQKDGGIYAGAYSSSTGACPFQVTSAGALTAISGRIGKFNLSNTYLYTGSGSTQAGMGGDQAFWAGSSTSNSAPFRVSYAGVLNASGATIQGDVTVSKLTVSSGATISDTTGLISNSAVKISGRNLFRDEPISYSSSSYQAYQIGLTENLVAGETYTIQFWDVNVYHTGKSDADLGIDAYWGGGSLRMAYWHGTSYFTTTVTDNNITFRHADHLTATFTVTSSQASGSGASNLWFNIYNSVSSASGTLAMSIGHWKIEKSNKGTDWSMAPEDMEVSINNLRNDISTDLEDLQTNLAAVTGDLQELNAYSETEIERITQNVNEYLGTNGYMLIEDQGLKITKGNFAVVITGTEILFQEDGNTVAWISGQKLYINRTEVTQSMKVGNFEWMIRTDGRLTLAYTGGN